MKKHFEDSIHKLDNLFSDPSTTVKKAWDIINRFLFFIEKHMKKKGISRSKVAADLGVSRSAVSQLFNGSPSNITVKKMVELANAVGLNLKFNIEEGSFETEFNFLTNQNSRDFPVNSEEDVRSRRGRKNQRFFQ